jgi:Abnormal spindle-like microcephaly-assoc'd, ASPM-SPD-2-Hydin
LNYLSSLTILRLVSRRLPVTACLSIALLFLLSGCAGYHGSSSASTTGAAITLSATSFNFNAVQLGQKVSQTLHISNSGKDTLQITSLAVTNKQFVIAGPAVPTAILPDKGLDFSLTFTPTATGSASATLSISSNASNSIPKVSLAGIGEKVVASVELSPTSINFGNELLQTATSKNVVLRNTSAASITFSGITVVGLGFGYSDLSPGYSLPPNQSVTFQVWFRPTVKGAAAGTISVLSASLASPASLSVAGDGVTSVSTPPPTNPAPSAQHTVHLSWDASASTVAGYRVYRSESATAGFQPINTSPVSATDYDDDAVASGTTYYYAITAITSAGVESAYSNEAKAVIPTP